MIAVLALVAVVAGVLLWALEAALAEPHGLYSFDVPPPEPYDGPIRDFED